MWAIVDTTHLSISSTTSWYSCWYSSTGRLNIFRGPSCSGAVEGWRLGATQETRGRSAGGMVALGFSTKDSEWSPAGEGCTAGTLSSTSGWSGRGRAPEVRFLFWWRSPGAAEGRRFLFRVGPWSATHQRVWVNFILNNTLSQRNLCVTCTAENLHRFCPFWRTFNMQSLCLFVHWLTPGPEDYIVNSLKEQVSPACPCSMNTVSRLRASTRSLPGEQRFSFLSGCRSGERERHTATT